MPISSPLPDPGDPVGPAEAKVDAFLREVRSRLNADTSVVSAPPGDPTDGEECRILLDEVQGIVGTFAYRAASGSPYKWEYVGGARVRVGLPGPWSPGLDAIVDVANTWTCPFSGEYSVSAGFASVKVHSLSRSTVELGVYVGATPSSFSTLIARRALEITDTSPESLQGVTRTITVEAGDVVHIGARASLFGADLEICAAQIWPVRIAG